MAILQMMRGPEEGRRFEFDVDRAVIGRHPDCAVRLDVAAISRQHAVISRQSGRYFIEDLGSRNGTFVNGRRLEEPAPLTRGDRVVICDLTFDFYPDAGDALAGPKLADESSLALLLSDDPQEGSSTSVMSKLDVSTDYSSIRLSAKPEAKLAAMIEISKNLSRAISIDEILPKLLESLFKIFVQADRGFVVMRDKGSDELVPRAIRSRKENDEGVVRMSRTIVDQAMNQREAILSADAASDQRFEMAESVTDFQIRSMMCAPILNLDGDALGVIQIDTLNSRSRFTDHDLEILAAVASQAAIAIDNASLHQQQWAQLAMKRDLELAHRVQQAIVPAEPPVVSGYQFFHYYQPANMVGGDYYDYVPLTDGGYAVVLGDVAGKGVPAALLMAKLSSDVRYTLVNEKDPAVAVSNINRIFAQRDWQDRFVTFAVVLLNPNKHEIQVVNAGHMAPLLRHQDGSVESLGEDVSGLPLGVVADFTYQAFSRGMDSGDMIVLYTDGINEAMNARKEWYSVERLVKQVGFPSKGVEDTGKQILDSVEKFVGNQSQADDIGLICFGRDGAAG